ncbi:MAG: hypothetical protein ACI9GH_000425 [Candidatus Paceibacteria bacterium]|jgi:hypothetical protein
MSKKVIKKKHFLVGFILVFVLVVFMSFFNTPEFFQTTYESGVNQVEDVLAAEEVGKKEPVDHIETPSGVKTIYMSACVAATPSFRKDLVDLVDETELNSIIVDIKDYTGTISFETELAGNEGTGCQVYDMKEFVQLLHDKNIYVIGRVTVFQDPLYTKLHPELAVKKASDGSVWVDHKGLSFVEVGARPYWDYIVQLAKESYDLGFDEINFDYIRFPSDGNMKDIYYPFSEERIAANPDNGKADALEEFFKYLHENIKDTGMVTSADLFGMTATNKDDLNIGQVLERTLPYFDYVAPMVYPSHYPNNFNGWPNPNDYPYEIIEFSMTTAFNRVTDMLVSTSTPQNVKDVVSTDQLRPWLQDFDYGGDYGPEEVRTQIQATYDSGLDSWMLWAASNRYTRGALLDN